MSYTYQRRVILIDLNNDFEVQHIHDKLYVFNGTEYKLVSVNQHENKLIYTFEKEYEVD